MASMQPTHNDEGHWIYSCYPRALQKVGLYSIAHFIEVWRQLSLFTLSIDFLNYAGMERKHGSSPSIFWWDQSMNLDNEPPDGANESAHPSFATDMDTAVESQLNWWLDGGNGPGDTSFPNNLEAIANDVLAWCTSSRAALRESSTKLLGAGFVMRAMEKAANDATEACSLNAFLAHLSPRLSWLVILATDSINSAMWANADVSPV